MRADATDAVALFHREFGDAGAPPIVILHGLLGSSRNWLTVSRHLATKRHVLALDLRNHGESPQTDEHGLEIMVGDVISWLDARALGPVHLVGHSMGGKVAMRLACDAPGRITHLTIVDIAPKDYHGSSAEIRAMQALDPTRLRSRREGEERLADAIPDRPTRRFLLTNLVRNDAADDDAGEGFHWQVNLLALARSLRDTRRAPLERGERFEGPAQFLLGGESPFVTPDDHALIRDHFPAAEIEIFESSGHNPHVDCPEEFVASVLRFGASDDTRANED